MAARWMSCKQIAHVGGPTAVVDAGGVVAPCAVQCCGESSVKSTSMGLNAIVKRKLTTERVRMAMGMGEMKVQATGIGKSNDERFVLYW